MIRAWQGGIDGLRAPCPPPTPLPPPPPHSLTSLRFSCHIPHPPPPHFHSATPPVSSSTSPRHHVHFHSPSPQPPHPHPRHFCKSPLHSTNPWTVTLPLSSLIIAVIIIDDLPWMARSKQFSGTLVLDTHPPPSPCLLLHCRQI